MIFILILFYILTPVEKKRGEKALVALKAYQRFMSHEKANVKQQIGMISRSSSRSVVTFFNRGVYERKLMDYIS